METPPDLRLKGTSLVRATPALSEDVFYDDRKGAEKGRDSTIRTVVPVQPSDTSQTPAKPGKPVYMKRCLFA